MSRSVLIDTNILLDAAMAERPEWPYAVALLDEIAYGNLQGYIAASSLKDVYNILSRYADEHSAREFICAALDAFTVVEIDDSLCRIAAHSNEPDFEDGLIRACAERVKANFIISRDKDAFQKSSLKRLSARDYVELFCPRDETTLEGAENG